MSETENTPAPNPRAPTQVTSVDEWAGKSVHEVTLPSGAIVSIRLPSLAQLVASGKLPNELLDSAIKTNRSGEVTRELLEETWDFTTYIVPLTVVAPAITADDVDAGRVPVEDAEMIVAFASRTTDIDAAHRHIGGLDTQQSFRDARGIFTTDEAVLGA